MDNRRHALPRCASTCAPKKQLWNAADLGSPLIADKCLWISGYELYIGSCNENQCAASRQLTVPLTSKTDSKPWIQSKVFINPLAPGRAKILAQGFSQTFPTITRQPIVLEICKASRNQIRRHFWFEKNWRFLNLRLFGRLHFKRECRFKLVWPRLSDPGLPPPRANFLFLINDTWLQSASFELLVAFLRLWFARYDKKSLSN